MSVPLDPGDVSLVLQVVILFLLVLGLPFVRGLGGKKNLLFRKNLLIHGYLAAFALILHTILIFVVMISSFNSEFGELGELSFVNSTNVWSHVILGTAAEVLGFVVVGFWVSRSPSKMACEKMKALMLPLFIVWTISLVSGTLIHVLEMM